MNYKTIKREETSVSGMSVALTTSQTKNFHIIRDHWQRFNQTLKTEGVNQSYNWEKFAIIYKVDGKYYYMTAVPYHKEYRTLTTSKIPTGEYVRFEHKGNMALIKETINNIYKNIIPTENIKIDKNRTFIQFEHYTSRFKWNDQNSIIDIYIPTITHNENQ